MARAASNSPAAPSRREIEMMVDFLGRAAEEFSQHGVNDFPWSDSSEAREIFEKLIRYYTDKHGYSGGRGSVENEIAQFGTGGGLFTFDFMVMEYFAARCKELLENNKPALSKTELELMSAALDMSSSWAADNGYEEANNEYWLPDTEENRLFAAAILKAAKNWQGIPSTVEIDESSGEIVLLECWVATYLAERCKAIAARM
jgi:hypothetical protein